MKFQIQNNQILLKSILLNQIKYYQKKKVKEIAIHLLPLRVQSIINRVIDFKVGLKMKQKMQKKREKMRLNMNKKKFNQKNKNKKLKKKD